MMGQPIQSVYWLTRCLIVLLSVSPESLAELRPEIGVRALAMGGAFVSDSDATSIFWNPAGLARLKRGHGNYDLSQGVVTLSYPVPYVGTLGFSFADLNSRDRFLVEHPNNPIGVLETGANQLLLSMGRHIGARWLIGGNFGINRAELKGVWTTNFDLGTMVQLTPNLSVGGCILDLTGTEMKNQEGRVARRFAQQVRFGMRFKPHPSLKFNVDYDSARYQLRFGTEVERSGIGVRIGLVANWNDRTSTLRVTQGQAWTGGFSISRWGKRLDYAYLQDANDERKHLLAVGFTFGGAHQAPTVLAPSELLNPKELPSLETHPKPPTRAPINRVTPRVYPLVEAGLPSQQPLRLFSDPFAVTPEWLKPTAQPALLSHSEESNASDLLESPAFRLIRNSELEVELVLALIQVESGFDPKAVSSEGAVGWMQLMPATARELGLKVPDYEKGQSPHPDSQLDERFDPGKNLEAGLRYLGQMLRRYDGNYVLGLCAYHAGASRVQTEVPSIRETERYVGDALNYYYRCRNDSELKQRLLDLLDAGLEPGS